MSKIKLFIATTIDGFIARENGSLDWLFSLPNPNNIDHGYNALIDSVDIIVMGRKTYDELLGFGIEWPYKNYKTYIITKNRNYQIRSENTFIAESIDSKLIDKLRLESNKNIWLVGGGNVITQFLNLGSIDEMIISVIPMILGRGLRLFPGHPLETNFELLDSVAFETGVVNLEFKKK
jgi:dihydrofolate reductase